MSLCSIIPLLIKTWTTDDTLSHLVKKTWYRSGTIAC